MSDFGGSNTPESLKDLWQTPIDIFTALDLEFGFYLDAAASHQSALCARYLTERDDALNSEWISYGAIWCNPPYSDIKPWVIKAAAQCVAQRQPVVMLVPADASVGWFSLALQSVDEVRFITDGRISFLRSDTGKPINGNNKGSLLLIWRPFINSRCIFTTVKRDDLRSFGRSILEGINAA
ncbi:phage N-6-adenine-methyltransferase [Yersinia ruckeri]|uniref:phage N-6-adenine-methyltransferase n=1 Tax=Yersinia ruckeri TaxID=29486 RepID=UPI002237CAD8|nr:phage N-6-adenine-methyltransferase [Yersinia ruckeri]EKN4687967.1 phage N-6-adenine-methyltransferase [Yersinia ruckeri]EKN4698539.1 phage N-6-adenine-methyltransferase [Yersinia ruckeri]ELI6453776.1 phage N-6-adenine-methyltransferase [Yersinia ruckeri]MCW6584336.1 phage N-6-adenine-methyltransferase [Yersinia ruckeri]